MSRERRLEGKETSEPTTRRDPAEGDTRHTIMLTLLKHAPVTAGEVADRLGLSAAGVRRHLDVLESEGMACTVRRRLPGKAAAPRGRPAKYFQLTDRGRELFGHDYDNLAQLALNALREQGGSEAVRALARARIHAILADVEPVGSSERTVEDIASDLAQAFDDNGYAATVRSAVGGVQICQHHCPISQVAAEFPELCEAEHDMIAQLTGLHVQPLASIANGNVVCTTNIPLQPKPAAPDERSGS